LFGSVSGITYHASNEEDAYITLKENVEEEEELNEMMIASTDNL
jgi:hypothetical protein